MKHNIMDMDFYSYNKNIILCDRYETCGPKYINTFHEHTGMTQLKTTLIYIYPSFIPPLIYSLFHSHTHTHTHTHSHTHSHTHTPHTHTQFSVPLSFISSHVQVTSHIHYAHSYRYSVHGHVQKQSLDTSTLNTKKHWLDHNGSSSCKCL